MYTWKLLVHVLLGWSIYENTVFVRDSSHDPIWYGVLRRIVAFRNTLMMASILVWIILVLFFGNLLIFFIPPLIFFMLVTALTLAPIVVEERAKLSWEALLTIPYDMETILLGKTSGALWHIRYLIYAMGALLFCISAGVGFISLTLIPVEATRTGARYEIALCGLLLIVPVMGSILFIVDRVQQYLLMVTAALASSTSTPSVRSALSMAPAAVLLIWFAEIAGTEVLLTLARGGIPELSAAHFLSIATLGPVVSYIVEMDLGNAILCIFGTLLVREMLMGLLWHWALRQARSLHI